MAAAPLLNGCNVTLPLDMTNGSGKPHVFARVHFEIQVERVSRVRFDDLLHELHENRVFAEDGVFVHRLKIDGDKERPWQLRIDSFSAFNAQNLWDFQQLHPRVHHDRLYTGGGDLGPEFIEDNVVNHGG